MGKLDLTDGAGLTRKRPSRVRLFGLRISRQSEDELLAELLDGQAAGTGPQLLATVNLDHVVNLRKNVRFRDAYAWAWRVTIDGAPVFAYAVARGVAPPARITGADLFVKLARMWNPAHHKLYFCLSSAEAESRMRTFLTKRGFANDHLKFEIPPFGFEKDAGFSSALAGRIREFGPTHLIMAVGAPKSEVWAYEHRELLGDMRILSVGASVEFLVGLKRRAPEWMRRGGLEWLWRLASEPRRLFRRYCIDSFGFLRAIGSDLKNNGESVV